MLKEHFSLVQSLDWHPKTNLLLSASTDRAVIVWNQTEQGNFMPKMGILRELKANYDAAWNTNGTKFCVGSSSGFVYVGSYQEEANFWVAHPMKKDKPTHKATVVCTRFDP